MDDEELCRRFGTTLSDVERDVEEFESGDWTDRAFGAPVEGRPEPVMKTASFKLLDYELAAIDRAAEQEGISRSAFIRRACANEVVALA